MIIIEIFEPGCAPRNHPTVPDRVDTHDRHRPVTTLQCCSQLPLPVDRWRACSTNDHSRAPPRSRADGNRSSRIASPGSATTLSRNGPHLVVTTATPQPIAHARQIPIAPARRTVVPTPARRFLPRGLSGACLRAALQPANGSRPKTLKESGRWHRFSSPRHLRAKPDKKFVDRQAARPSPDPRLRGWDSADPAAKWLILPLFSAGGKFHLPGAGGENGGPAGFRD
jgi:hypothetical protein